MILDTLALFFNTYTRTVNDDPGKYPLERPPLGFKGVSWIYSKNLTPEKTPLPWYIIDGPRLKVSQIQNEFMRSSFLLNYQPKITEISALGVYYRVGQKSV